MTTTFQPRIPANKDACISKVGSIHRVTVRLVRPDGSMFRKSSDRKSIGEARKLRDLMFEQFNVEVGGPAYAKKLVAQAGGPTVSAFYDQLCLGAWKDVTDKNIRQRRQQAKDYIVPVIGTLPIAAVTVGDLRRLVEGFAATPVVVRRSAKKPQSTLPGMSSLKHVKQTLSLMFRHAVEEQLVAVNPVASLTIRWDKLIDGRETTDPVDEEAPDAEKLLTAKERRVLLAKAQTTIIYPALFLQDHLGLRPSEALVLRMKDFDLTNETVRIGRALKWNGKIGATKTRVIRTIDLPDAVVQYIKGLQLSPDQYITRLKDGGLVEYRRYFKVFMDMLERSQIKRPVTPYWFRHTFASRLLNECGGSPVDVAKILGNSPAVLLAYYAHSDAKNRRSLMKGKKGSQGPKLALAS